MQIFKRSFIVLFVAGLSFLAVHSEVEASRYRKARPRVLPPKKNPNDSFRNAHCQKSLEELNYALRATVDNPDWTDGRWVRIIKIEPAYALKTMAATVDFQRTFGERGREFLWALRRHHVDFSKSILLNFLKEMTLDPKVEKEFKQNYPTFAETLLASDHPSAAIGLKRYIVAMSSKSEDTPSSTHPRKYRFILDSQFYSLRSPQKSGSELNVGSVIRTLKKLHRQFSFKMEMIPAVLSQTSLFIPFYPLPLIPSIFQTQDPSQVEIYFRTYRAVTNIFLDAGFEYDDAVKLTEVALTRLDPNAEPAVFVTQDFAGIWSRLKILSRQRSAKIEVIGDPLQNIVQVRLTGFPRLRFSVLFGFEKHLDSGLTTLIETPVNEETPSPTNP